MDEELRCPACAQLFSNPVLLPCGHAMCLHCALQHQTSELADGEGETSIFCTADLDKLSVTDSETDSGVVLSSSLSLLRPPAAYVTPPPATNGGAATPALLLLLRCLSCRQLVRLDANGAYNLPRFRVMQRIVDGYQESRDRQLRVTSPSALPSPVDVVDCQLCDTGETATAAFHCANCDIAYCHSCLERCHPARGPLARHVVSPLATTAAVAASSPAVSPASTATTSSSGGVCDQHVTEKLVNYCVDCRRAVCNVCIQQQQHRAHQLHALNTVARLHKTDLSQNLQHLTERVKKAADYIHQLKTVSDQVMVSDATVRLQQTNALLMFCIEALKEKDDSAFLQVSQLLSDRVTSFDRLWGRDMTSPEVNLTADLDLMLDTSLLEDNLANFHFVQLQPPGAPVLLRDNCGAENNVISLSWQPHMTSHHDGFVVQLNDGSVFKEYVISGCQRKCRLASLHFNTQYQCTVRGYNSSGHGSFSDTLTLCTSAVARFTLDSSGCHDDVCLSNNDTSATCRAFESRVVLASVGLSRGRHFWRFCVDRYDGNADPAFGMARADVNREMMLGKDDKGWSMYIDDKRSWLMHQDMHSGRVEGGVRSGDNVGVLLDLDAQNITFYVNNVIQGRIDFSGLQGTFYPAVSINRNVSVSLTSGLTPPPDCHPVN